MAPNAFEAFAQATIAQVKTVFVETKTAAIVIFLCGLVAGCIVF